jgi:hypothetical protein
MQAFPVGNLHSHAQPILSYLRLLGVEPTAEGALRVGDGSSGGSFTSPCFELRQDGHGRLLALGDVTVSTARGTVRGPAGEVRW